MMKIEIYSHADEVARQTAKLIAKEARDAVATRGEFVMAVTGGKTSWIMLRDLAQEDVPWKGLHVEMVAGGGFCPPRFSTAIVSATCSVLRNLSFSLLQLSPI